MSKAKMQQSRAEELAAPRFENGKALLIAGLRGHFTGETMREIPALWQRYVPYIRQVPSRVGGAEYGVCWNSEEGLDYLAGMEVAMEEGLPKEFSVVRIPAQKYAIFVHRGHVSKLHETCEAIFRWLPRSGYRPAVSAPEAPGFFERYSAEFDPQTGIGGMEVWVPVM